MAITLLRGLNGEINAWCDWLTQPSTNNWTVGYYKNIVHVFQPWHDDRLSHATSSTSMV